MGTDPWVPDTDDGLTDRQEFTGLTFVERIVASATPGYTTQVTVQPASVASATDPTDPDTDGDVY